MLPAGIEKAEANQNGAGKSPVQKLKRRRVMRYADRCDNAGL
jgi:hypothetical protein